MGHDGEILRRADGRVVVKAQLSAVDLVGLQHAACGVEHVVEVPLVDLLGGEGPAEVAGGPAQGLVQRVGGQGRALAVPVGIGFEVQGLLLSPEEGETVQVVHALPLQFLRQPLGVVGLAGGGEGEGRHMLRVEGVLIRGDGEEKLRPLFLTVFRNQGQIPGGGENLPVRHGVQPHVVRQGVGEVEPAVRAQHHVLGDGAAQGFGIQGRPGGDHVLPEVKVVPGVVLNLGEVIGVPVPLRVPKGGGPGEGLIAARRALLLGQEHPQGGNQAQQENERRKGGIGKVLLHGKASQI